ncbi:MAG: hypothetical protein BLITH_0240 [Brockia lithotrophica]|uniref:Uncharacterized protein n=1 Tax=Brockia lithotrophica TaxID=933949 RepID=A0A2T5GAF8_9BACL|nr:MAG: hypothetical protein BLITH_0240 [Brockia lithotrophica]
MPEGRFLRLRVDSLRDRLSRKRSRKRGGRLLLSETAGELRRPFCMERDGRLYIYFTFLLRKIYFAGKRNPV